MQLDKVIKIYTIARPLIKQPRGLPPNRWMDSWISVAQEPRGTNDAQVNNL